MSKPETRALSPYSRDALSLLAQMIRRARIERGLTVQELADRAGVSRGLIQRIERGDPGCAIGAVFEAAAIVGIRLFDADQPTMAVHLAASGATLALLPKTVRPSGGGVKDDF
ncbi:transcriptional regulator [Pleomorphomonas diazotrophica]|uniref:Transcriptional regulator n=1 Tax=Pleomorphomonas diazotrophica TaxID=1166257 RepID=A0A1I4UKL6_9HYPH|nr:helix-turn-helix transcriptional regulator [Pleomorphomonas diazotrophica]PKR88390.1 transcriptional regulator [Pleomorphomonas diazotrophica]SFM89522.1 Helix-turn-helix domain-containing protein [Pleomorphomonas diazotrophica]